MLQERYIDRKEMPQIAAKNLADCLNYLKKNGISNQAETVPAGQLVQMQRLNQAKVETLTASPENLKKPVLVTKDYELVDGHHRWAANRDMGNDQEVIKLDASFEDIFDALTNYDKVFHIDIHESVSLVLRSYAGNSIIASVNGKKYEYIIDGDTEALFRQAQKISRHSTGKALNLIKKHATGTIKEQETIQRRFFHLSVNTLLEEIFKGI